jgi:hypothetical protein
MERPAPARTFQATVTRSFPTLTQRHGGPVQVKVNGDVVRPGEHTAEVLALLGIIPDDVDDVFWRYVGQGHWPLIAEGTMAQFDEWAATHQEGAGWEIEADVAAANGVVEVRDLAYVDDREVHRYLTMRVRDWNHLSYKEYADNGFDASVKRTSSLSSRGQTLESGGAVGSWYSGIDAEEITATRNAANALEAARRNLQHAYDEIEIAIKVADAAWKGDRADAMKYKFCLEATVVDAVTQVTHAWEDFTQDVVRQQGLAKDHDDKLKREVATEVGITIVVGIVTFGAGAVIKGSLFAAKLAKWARDVEILRRALQSRHAQTLAGIARSTGVVRALRASRMGTVEVGATVAVKGSTGQELTADELLTRFLFAAGLQAGSDLWRFGLRPIGDRFGVHFDSPAARGVRPTPPREGPELPPGGRPRGDTPPAGAHPTPRPHEIPPATRPARPTRPSEPAEPGGDGPPNGRGGDPAGPPTTPGRPAPHGGGGDGPTRPSIEPSPTNRPRGRPQRINPRDDEATRRSLQRENDSADVLARHGYDLEHQPHLPEVAPRKPDYLIEGRIFDNYAPGRAGVRNIWSEVYGKVVDKQQADRIILNLTDSRVTMDALRRQFADWPIEGLKEIIIVKGETVIPFFP